MKTRTLVYITSSIAMLLIFATNPLLLPMAYSQEEDEDEDEEGPAAVQSPSATIVNSKYLALSNVTFNEADNQVTIAGTISNLSPDQSFINVVVVVQLYDEANMLITTATGRAGLANLQPGQQSAFTMTTNIPSEDEVSRYTVLPGGSLA